MHRHTLAPHQARGEGFKIFPINIYDFMFQAACLRITCRHGTFVGHLHAGHDAAECVCRGAPGHEFGEDGRVHTAGKARGPPCRLCRPPAWRFPALPTASSHPSPAAVPAEGDIRAAARPPRNGARCPAMVRYVRKALMQYSRSTIPLTPRYSPRTAASALETCVEETPRV